MASSNAVSGSADTLAHGANHAVRATRQAADKVLDDLSDRLEGTREPALDRLISQAETLAKRGLDAVRDRSHVVRDKAADMSDRTVLYIKDEPVKSILFAAAAGAVIVLATTLLGSLLRRD